MPDFSGFSCTNFCAPDEVNRVNNHSQQCVDSQLYLRESLFALDNVAESFRDYECEFSVHFRYIYIYMYAINRR